MTRLIRLKLDESCLEQGVRFVGFTDEMIIEEGAIIQMGKELFGLFNRRNPNYHPDAHVCMDFEGVGFFASMALGKLIAADKKQVAEYKRHLGVVNIRPKIYETFIFTRLNRVFNIAETPEDYLVRFCP